MQLRIQQRNKQGKPVISIQHADPKRTGLFIMDAWDKHWCAAAQKSSEIIIPKIDHAAKIMRSLGVPIMHMPSDCMDFYNDHPQRLKMQDQDQTGISRWVYYGRSHNWLRYGRFPIHIGRENGCPCRPHCKVAPIWTRQHPAITILPEDLISDHPREVYAWLKANHIEHILYAGFHANICLLDRPLGIRKMRKLGFNTYLFRDLTDIMYDPAQRPRVAHEEAFEKVMAYIEKNLCPTLTITGAGA